MTDQPIPSTDPNFVDSLLHPQAILIRQLLTRTGRIELSRILIDDEGIGVPPTELPHVFERHFRGEAARRHRSDGAGLGLAIAHLIAHAHHGEVALVPRRESGARAVVTLPREASPA